MAITTCKRTLCALAVALAAGTMQQANAIGLLKAYDLALQNDPVYRSALAENAAGRENAALARSQLLPNVSASYGVSHNRTDLTQPGFTGALVTSHPVYSSKTASVSLRQPLLALDLWARAKQGNLQVQFADAALASRYQETIVRIVSAYVEALFAEEQLALVQSQRDTLAEQRKLNERAFTQGEAARTDVLETQARLDVSEAQLLESQDNVRATRLALEQIVGQPVEGLDRIGSGFKVEMLKADELAQLKEQARLRNPDIQSMERNLDLAKTDIDRNKAGHAPRVDLYGTYSNAKSDTLNTYNQDSLQRSVGVQVSIPLYQGGYVNAATRQAVAASTKAEADLQAHVDKVMLDLRKAFDAIVSSSAKISALQKAVESSTLLVTATEKSIKGGVRINLDLLNAQQQKFQAQRDLAQARYTYVSNLIRLRASVGTLGLDDVKQVAGFFE